MKDISNGFQKHPENINRNGRPRKDESITSIMRNTLQKQVETKEGKKELREIFCDKVIQKALKGDMQAIKIIWNYIDGMPKQTHDVESNNKLNINFVKDDEKVL